MDRSDWTYLTAYIAVLAAVVYFWNGSPAMVIILIIIGIAATVMGLRFAHTLWEARQYRADFRARHMTQAEPIIEDILLAMRLAPYDQDPLKKVLREVTYNVNSEKNVNTLAWRIAMERLGIVAD